MGLTMLATGQRVGVSVHPHVRGAYRFETDGETRNNGSSPRAWGLRFFLFLILFFPQFIPTCVGLTKMDYWPERGDMVHPHVRGAYASLTPKYRKTFGSSPRAWGLLDLVRHVVQVPRFIPTCVGLTQGHKAGSRAASVHPHVRGAYAATAA